MTKQRSFKAEHRDSLIIQYSDKAKWISKLSRDHLFSASEKVVGVVLCDYFNTQTGEAWPSLTRLEQDAGTSRRTVIRALKKLESARYLTARRARGRGKSNLYSICLAHKEETKGAIKAPAKTDTTSKSYADVQCSAKYYENECQKNQTNDDGRAPQNRYIYTNKETSDTPTVSTHAKAMALLILKKSSKFICVSDPLFEVVCNTSKDKASSKKLMKHNGNMGLWFLNEDVRKAERQLKASIEIGQN